MAEEAITITPDPGHPTREQILSGDMLSPGATPLGLQTQESVPVPSASTPSDLYGQEQAQLAAYRNQPGIIVVDSKPKVPANVLLGGQPYRVLPLKSLVLINMITKLQNLSDDPTRMLAEMESFVSSVFGRKMSPEIMARLTDPDDDLDLQDVMELIKELAKRATGNPTL